MSATVRYLSAEDVRVLMPSMIEVVEIVEETLRHHGAGNTQMPPKIDLGPAPDSFLHAMPAFVQPTGAVGMKWVAGYPANPAKHLPYIHGTLLLNDAETGKPTGIMDASVITGVRTGACTAVTAKHLADPASEVMAIIGCGVQGRTNIEALLAVFPDTERMLAYDIDPERQAQFADEIMTTFDVASVIPPDPQECCEGAHIIVTSLPIVKNPQPMIEPEWLQTGTLCVPLDFDASFTPGSFARSDLFVTDDLEQFRRYQALGYFKDIQEPSGDLGAIINGNGPVRPEGTPIVMSANLGLGILDVALGARILQLAEEKDVGTQLPL
jgi:ornithine cyclodeaminase/alanine dehydrogenase